MVPTHKSAYSCARDFLAALIYLGLKFAVLNITNWPKSVMPDFCLAFTYTLYLLLKQLVN